MGYTTPLLIAALVATAAAGPTGLRQTCATTCSETSKFAFEKGFKYEYDYKINTNTKDLYSTPDANAELAVTARATIDVVGPCEFALTLSDVSLEGSSHTSSFGAEITKSPLRFGFDEGRISDVCSQIDEPVWVINFKRGILSMFQNTMATVHKNEIVTDVDITGECETEYKVSDMSDGDTVVVDRTKSSDSCNHIAIGSHSTLPSPLQRLLLSSKETCVQKITAGIIDEVTCNQFIKFRETNSATVDTLLAPIAAADEAITKVTTSLIFVSSTYGASVSDFEMSHISIEFDGLTSEVQGQQKILNVETILKELDENSNEFIKSEVPILFTRLVENLRQLDTKEMELIYESNRLSRVWKFLVDAAPMVATPASMVIVSDLVTLGQLSHEEADVWFTSMGFIPNPKLDMFLPLPNVLKTYSSDKALLGVSALINSYCKIDSSCQEKEVIQDVLNEIEKNIGSGCRSYSFEHKQKILTTLRALGNAGRFINSVALETCFLDSSNPAEVRVAALEVWRRAPCSFDRTRLMELYSEPTHDSELRISAYLSMMACPTDSLIDTIKRKLTSESVNQVGSFVWTHLSNLQESASAQKQWIRELIGEETLINKFNTSTLKFSRNYESSFFMQEQGFGTTFESNVVFSQKSFLPRSGMLNLTFDVFGQPLNLLEVGGRMEGLEIFIEKFFGPDGYYPEETVEAIIKSMRQGQSPQETTLEHMLESVTDEQEGSYYVRLLGNDILYHHFTGIENFFDKNSKFNIIEMVMDLTRTGKVDYTKSFNLIDSSFKYPTLSGLPLQLELNSKATVGLKMDGQFSGSSLRDINIIGQIRPSAAIHSDVSVMIDAHFSKYGRKTTVDMQTSTYLDGKLEVSGGKLVDIKLNMPHDKIELVNVQYEKIFVEDDKNVTPKISENRNKIVCTPTSDILGAKLCFSEEFDENFKYQLALNIEKTDTQTGYIASYSHDSSHFNFMMDTPGSTVDRKLSVSASITDAAINIELHTPWKTFAAAGNREITENSHKYSMTVTADKTVTYEMEADYSILRQASVSKIDSTIKVVSNSIDYLNAHVTFETNKVEGIMNLEMKDTGDIIPSSLQFYSQYSDSAKRVEAHISSSPLKLSATGSVELGEKFASQFDAKYSLFGKPEESISHYMKCYKSQENSGLSYEYAFFQKVSQMPKLDVDAKGKFALAPGHLEFSTSLNYGENDFEMKSNNLITYDVGGASKAYDVKMSFVSITHNIDVLLTQNFKLTPKSLFRETYLRLTPYYVFSTKVDAGYREGSEGYIRLKISAPYYEQKHELSFTKVAEKHYTAKALSNMNGVQTSVDLIYQDKSRFSEYIDVLLGSKIMANEIEINSNFILKGDPIKGITLDAISNYNNKKTFVKLEATKTYFKLESNIYKPLLVDAKIAIEGPTRSVELEGHWDSTDFMTNITFDNQSILGNFKYGTIAKGFKAEIGTNGVNLEVFLDAVKVIKAAMEYEIGEEMVFTAYLNTPFENYEKQSANFAFKTDGNKAIDGRINVTWKNSLLLSFIVMGNFEISTDVSQMNLESVVVGNPDLLGFERFQYELKHSRTGAEINSSMSGISDGNKIIDGKIETMNSLTERRIKAYLKTPITKDLTFESAFQVKKSLQFEVNYGEHFLNCFAKLSSVSKPGFKFNFEILSSVSTDISFEMVFTGEPSRKMLEMEATFGNQKGLAVFTQDIDHSSHKTKVTNSGRIVLPHMTPITGSLIVTMTEEGKPLIVDFEVTRFWSSYGSLMVHGELLKNAPRNMESLITVTSPDYKMAFNTMHKLESNNFDGFFKSSINGNKFDILANGILNMRGRKVKLNCKVLKQDELFMRVVLDYEKQGEIHVTKVKLNVDDATFNIHHEFSYADLFNWNNELSFNDFFIKNKMTKKILTDFSETYTHEFDWNMSTQFIRGEVRFETALENDGMKQIITTKCSSSKFNEIEFEATRLSEPDFEKVSVAMLYGFHRARITSEFLFGENWTFKTDATSTAVDDISLTVKKTGDSRLEIEMKENNRVSKLIAHGECTTSKKAVHLTISTPILPQELMIDGIFEQSSDIYAISLSASSDEINRVFVSSSKDFNRKGKAEISLELPFFDIQDTSFLIEFDCTTEPIDARASIKLQGVQHAVDVKLSKSSLEMNANVAGIRGKLESSWEISSISGDIDIKLSSSENNFILEGKIAGDRVNKMMKMYLKYNSETIFSLLGKHEGRSAVLQGELFLMMNTLYSVNILCNDSHFTGSFSQDSQKVEVVGNYNFNRISGEYAFNVDSTFAESITLNGDYDFSAEKRFNLKVKSGDKEVSARVAADFERLTNPSLSADVTSFHEKYRKVGTSMTFDLRGASKILDVKVYHNDDQYTWKMEAISEKIGKAQANIEATSPIVGFENMKYGLNYEISRSSYNVDLYREKNSERDEVSFEASVDVQDKSFSGTIKTTVNELEEITFNGRLIHDASKISPSLIMTINRVDSITIDAIIHRGSQNPSVEINWTSPYEGFRNIMVSSMGVMSSNEIKVATKLTMEDKIYNAEISAKKSYKKASAEFIISTPLEGYSSFSVKGDYDLSSDIKLASVDFEVNGVAKHASVDLELNDNHIKVTISTPLPDYETIIFEGNMTNSRNGKEVKVKVMHGSSEYDLFGSVDTEAQQFILQSNTPDNLYGQVELSGRKTSIGYSVIFSNNGEKSEIKLEYNLEPSSFFVRLETPLSGYTNVAIEFNLDNRPGTWISTLKFIKEDFIANLGTKIRYSNLKSHINLMFKVPKFAQDIALNIKYDFTSDTKTAQAFVKINDREETFDMTAHYEPNAATFELTVPFIKKHVAGEYKLTIDKVNKEMDALFKATVDEDIYEFNAYGKIGLSMIEIVATTPFEKMNKIEASASINRVEQTAAAQLQFGSQTMSMKLQYGLSNALLDIQTPFEILEHLMFATSFVNEVGFKQLGIETKYNEEKSGVNAIYKPGYVLLELERSNEIYKIEISGEINEQRGNISMAFQYPPSEYFRDVDFLASIDLTSADKSIEVFLRRGEDIKEIALIGRFINDEAELKLKTPIAGFENFQTRGSLSRSKRSLEFTMMNDSALGAIRANFNSLKIDIKTPYGAAREASFTMERTDGGGLSVHYKRGDNHFDMTATPTGRRRSFEVSVKSAIPGWEYLAITGRLDKEELIGYLSGQINEEKMTITGGGKYSRQQSDLRFDITTPYDGYESVSILLKSNVRRKEFSFEIKSGDASNAFHIKITTKPNLIVDIYVPNPAEPTIMKASFTLFKGEVTISSRFPKARSFSLAYEVVIGRDEVDITSHIELNEVKLFDLEFKRGVGGAHLKIDARRGENHSTFHFHREGLQSIEMTFNRNGREFKLQASSTGSPLQDGTVDLVINNSFRENPVTVSGRLIVDRTGSPKKIKLELTYPGMKLYVYDLTYNISLRNTKTGDYRLAMTFPDKRARPWQNISGSWDFTKKNDAVLTFKIGRSEFTAKGKFGLREADFVVTPSNGPKIEITWRFLKTSTPEQRTRDYYLKVGTSEKFIMAKLKGIFSGLEHGETEFALHTPSMRAELNGNINWHRDASGLSGTGSFTYGSRSGTFTLNKLKRYAETRSAEISFVAKTNIPDYTTVSVEGKYSFNNEAVLKLDIVWDTDKISINFDIHDIFSEFTEQSASFTLPELGDVSVTFGHDFRNKKKRTFTATATVQGLESFIKAEWNRNKDFTKLSGKADAKSIFLGDIHVTGKYDVRDIHNANAEFHYKRNDDKSFDLKWSRVYNDRELNAEVSFESSFGPLNIAKITIHGLFVDQFKLDGTLQINERRSSAELNVVPNSITFLVTTPRKGFERIEGSLVYDFSNKSERTATLRYARGDVSVKMDFKLQMPSNNNGQLELTLETPFEIVRTLEVTASWKNRKGEVHYRRNNIEYHFSGQADIKADRTSFEGTFTPSSDEPIKIGFTFNSGSFITGRGTAPEDVARIELEMLGKRVAFDLKGFRNAERIMVEIHTESSFDALKKFELKLDSELSTQERDGLFETTINDFHFRIRNHFERKSGDGFYFRTEIDTTMTALPGLILGFGKEGDACIITVGFGEDREVTVTVIPKNEFKKGFSGKLSLPKRGIIDAPYDVNYSFTGGNILNIDTHLELEPGKMIEADIVYNSDGVKARLSSPRTGRRTARARRSVTEDAYFFDAGVDDYSITMFAKNVLSKKGYIVEGQIFGTKVSIDSLLNLEGSNQGDGRLIISTNLEGYETLGGMFSFSNKDSEIHSRAEINLPSHITPKAFISVDLDLKNKIKGSMTFDLSGQVFLIETDVTGSLKDGFTGEINLRTPIHYISQVSMRGSIKMGEDYKFLDSSIVVDYPLGTKEIIAKYSRDPLRAEVKLSDSFHVKLITEDVKHQLFLDVLGNIMSCELQTTDVSKQARLLIDLRKSGYINSPLAFEVSHSIASPMRVSSNLSVTIFEETHSLSLTVKKSEKEITFVLQSSLVGGKHMFAIKIDRCFSNSFAGQISYIGNEIYELTVDIDMIEGIQGSVIFSCPRGTSKFEIEFTDSGNATKLKMHLQLPNSDHDLGLTADKDINYSNSEGNISAQIILSSSFLSNDIIYSVKGEYSKNTKITEQVMKVGDVEQYLKAGYTYNNRGVKLEISFDTPLFELGKNSITAELKLNELKRVIVKLVHHDDIHTLDVKVNIEDKTISAVSKSDYWPGGLIKSEVSVIGDSMKDMSFLASCKYNKLSFGAKLDIYAGSMDNIKSALEVRTPYPGYKKMNFLTSFIRDDFVTINFIAERPIGCSFELTTGKSDEEYKAEIDIKTPYDGFESISAGVNIPTMKVAPKMYLTLPESEYGLDFAVENDKFSSKVEGNVNINGKLFGAGFGLRNSPPYELAYFARNQDVMQQKFHIMMDSSFFSIFSLLL